TNRYTYCDSGGDRRFRPRDRRTASAGAEVRSKNLGTRGSDVEKVALPNRRVLLLCELEDGGMGHQLHDLYRVDLTAPVERGYLIYEADTFDNGCDAQQKQIEHVRWSADRRLLSVQIATSGFRNSTRGRCAGNTIRKHRAGRRKALHYSPTTKRG